MSDKSPAKRPWTRRRKILIGGIAVLIALALALGLGLGLTLGNDDEGDDDDDDGPALTPLPSPNGTLPWIPKVNESWQIILSHPPLVSDAVTPDVDIFDVDLFDTPATTIAQLHKLGKKVICYFSAGSYESWRSDAKDFSNGDLGNNLDDWPGEKWLRLSSENVRGIMKKRVVLAREKRCDAVDPDNVDGYVSLMLVSSRNELLTIEKENDNGMSLTKNDSIDYMEFLSSITRPLNLTLGLKNAGAIIDAVLPLVDFSVNEQCAKYGECEKFHSFIAAGKPVFHIEYPGGDGDLQQNIETNGFSEDTKKKFCGTQGSDGFSTVLKKMNLDGWVQYCDAKVQVTDVDENTGGHD
jgi:hypothetical protein